MNDHNLIQYAFNKQGQRISVYDVPFGNKTSCFCRICGQPLGAKNKGKTRDTILEPYQKSAHFYHLNDSQCHGETLIHIIAKEVLKKLRKIKFLIEVRNHNDELLEFKTSEKELHEIESEYEIQVSEDKKVRPDIKAIIENKPLFIEFAYSSYIDYEKKYFIKKSRLNVIEIELNVPYINWNDFKSEEELEKKMTEFLEHLIISDSNWVNNLDFGFLITEVIDTTEEDLKEEEERRNQLEFLKVKLELLRSALRLSSINYVRPVLMFEEKYHLLNDENFTINDEGYVNITDKTQNELNQLYKSCSRDWIRIEPDYWEH